MKLCLYFTNDLVFSSRVKPVAIQAGYEMRFPGFEEADLAAEADLIVFDLEFISKDEMQQVLSMLEEQSSQARTIAYAPHVKIEKLDAARDLGVETVWSRGQFNKNFSQLFQQEDSA